MMSWSLLGQSEQRRRSMKLFVRALRIAASLSFALAFASGSVLAAEYPAPKEADAVLGDFRFHSGEVFSELKVHYQTVGAPTGEPVLVLHGTAELLQDEQTALQ